MSEAELILMSLLAVRLEAIAPSGESHAEASLIGQAFPVQPSVPASWDMLFHVKSFNGLFIWLFTWLFILFYEYACSMCMGVCTLMPEEDVGFLPLPHATSFT